MQEDKLIVRSLMCEDPKNSSVQVIRVDKQGNPELVQQVRGKKAVELYRKLVILSPLERIAARLGGFDGSTH